MAGRSVANRSETVTVATPRGRSRWCASSGARSVPGVGWQWEWLARRGGQRDWKQGSTAREAIRQATLLPPGKQPGWLTAAVAEAERGLSAQPAEPPGSAGRARTPVELRASTAVPAAFARRPGGGGERRRGAARAGCRERGSGAARRAAAPHRVRARPLRSPLARARRSQSRGARSEDDVQRALAPLRAEGWRLRHSLPWQGGGDIDSVAIAPTGIAVAIETKTRTL